jgi:hypothetical protein
MDEKFSTKALVPDKEYEKHNLHDDFLSENPELREHRLHKQLTVFSKNLKRYAQFTDGLLKIEERKSGKDRFITFLSDKQINIF